MWHHDFKYKEGLNVDTKPFQPKGSCEPGGLYYTSLEHLALWFNEEWSLIADVTVPADARVYAEPCGTKWKADRIELSNIRPVVQFLLGLDVDQRIAIMLIDPYSLKFMPQTEEICLEAVRRNGLLLKYVRQQTDAICLAAVQTTGLALYWVRNRTPALCLVAVQNDSYALQYVPEQTEALRLIAVQRNGHALRLMENQSEAVCLAAVQQDGTALCWVREQTEAICLAAVRRNGFALAYVHNQTEAICRAAVAQSPGARCYIKIPIDF
jgi:hypothetical protein